LIDDGRIALKRPLSGNATYHDPCYLGRYNRVFDAPRQVIARTGLKLVEMPRNRAGSFCCGAGGGQIWKSGAAAGATNGHPAERPSEQRIREALALGGVQYFVVACPKDVAMYTDAVKTSGNEGKIVVKDIAELVLEAMATGAKQPA
jgi:Fe-S oxidoreductase